MVRGRGAASALSHPNICTILALGETSDGQHYIAMEHVEGDTLRRRLAGPLRAVDGTRFDRTAATASSFKYLAPDESAEEGW